MAENNHVEPLERALVPPRKFAFLRDNPNWRSLVAAVEESFRDGIPQWLADAEEAGLKTPDLQRVQVDVFDDVFTHFSTRTWDQLWDISRALYEANVTSHSRFLPAERAFMRRDLQQTVTFHQDPAADHLWNPLVEALTELVDKHIADLFQPGTLTAGGASPLRPVDGPKPTPSDITYDCPQGGLDPFDVCEARTQHLFVARGWCRAWVASEAADAQAYDDAYRGGVPMGYKSLVVHEKLAVVDGGSLIAGWEETATPSVPPHHEADFEPYRLLVQAGARDVGSHLSYEDALGAALDLSRREGGAMMVSRLLAVHAWH